MQRHAWFQWHRFFGLPLAIFLCFVLFTGTLSTISNEIDWLSNPAMRADSKPQNQQVAWKTIYKNALKAANEHQLETLSSPINRGFAASAVVRSKEGQRSRLFFHPATGELQGAGRWYNWQRTLRRLHRNLMLPATLGITIVSSTSLLFIGLFITGLLMQRNWLKSLFSLPRLSNRKVFWRDAHNLAALWSSWLLLVVSITGIWYLAERWGLEATYPAYNQTTDPISLNSTSAPSALSFAAMLKTVQSARPELTINNIRFSNNEHAQIVFEGSAHHLLVRDRANNVAINPLSGEIVSVRIASDLSLHARISEAADPIHFGIWGGYPSKIVYFLFGLLLTFVTISGTYIYALRISSGADNRDAKGLKICIATWHKTGNIKWGSVLLVIVALVAMVWRIIGG